MMTTTLLPRLVYGTQIGLHFDGTADFPERITATTPDGQYAGHVNFALAEVIYASRHRLISMTAVCQETSHRRAEGWVVEVSYSLRSV